MMTADEGRQHTTFHLEKSQSTSVDVSLHGKASQGFRATNKVQAPSLFQFLPVPIPLHTYQSHHTLLYADKVYHYTSLALPAMANHYGGWL